MSISTDEQKYWRDLSQKKLNSYTLMDDAFMTACFKESTDAVQYVLRIILNRPNLKVIETKTQETLKNMNGLSVCLDVLAADSQGSLFNIEIQVDLRGASMKRILYNMDSIAVHSLPTGEDVDNLPDIYAICITAGDFWRDGRSLVRMGICDLDTGKQIGSDRTMIWFNAAHKSDDDLGKLGHDLLCPDPDKMYSAELARPVRYFKNTERGREVMYSAMEDLKQEWMQFISKKYEKEMDEKVNEARNEGRNEGRNEARIETKLDLAEKCIRSGEVNPKKVPELFELSQQEAQELLKRLEKESNQH